ncbi:MAG: hypothetical protein M1820_001644 [Bogoriella megaspora]|nr:MAG: hypothetical protein M1820_001644 [Bogoriella megaspora]
MAPKKALKQAEEPSNTQRTYKYVPKEGDMNIHGVAHLLDDGFLNVSIHIHNFGDAVRKIVEPLIKDVLGGDQSRQEAVVGRRFAEDARKMTTQLAEGPVLSPGVLLESRLQNRWGVWRTPIPRKTTPPRRLRKAKKSQQPALPAGGSKANRKRKIERIDLDPTPGDNDSQDSEFVPVKKAKLPKK